MKLVMEGDQVEYQQVMYIDRESAFHSLFERRYSNDGINPIISDGSRRKRFSVDKEDTEIGSKAVQGVVKGCAIGGTAGAIAGVTSAIGTSLANIIS